MNKTALRIIVSTVCALTAWSIGTAGQSFGGISLTAVEPRICTPNGDNFNDKIFFKFDNTLAGLPYDSAIYDVTGARVASMNLDSGEKSLTWDGRDDGGKSLPTGIYIYQITIGQKKATGTVVLAR